jgi:hypothetical protein
MKPLQYEIYDARMKYRNCNDVRPVIIIEVLPNDLATVALISGAMDLYQGNPFHFALRMIHPDFTATGLKKDCYVAGDQIFTIETKLLVRKRGQLNGDLRLEFQKWV